MKTEEIFNQENLNKLLDYDIIFSANIMYKVMNSQLKIKESCLSDWLESLSNEELNIFIVYFNQIKGEVVEKIETEEVISQDLTSCLELLYFLECGTSDGFDGEKMENMLELLDMASTIELLKRDGELKIIEKIKISDENSGLVEAVKPKKTRKPRGKKT